MRQIANPNVGEQGTTNEPGKSRFWRCRLISSSISQINCLRTAPTCLNDYSSKPACQLFCRFKISLSTIKPKMHRLFFCVLGSFVARRRRLCKNSKILLTPFCPIELTWSLSKKLPLLLNIEVEIDMPMDRSRCTYQSRLYVCFT